MVSFKYISTFSLPLLLSHLTAGQTVPRFETYSLGTVSNFRLIRPCILCCFDNDGCGASVTDLPDAVGCPVNSCLCRRADISTSASLFLNECVSRRCQGSPTDIADAQNAYQAYCSVYMNNIGLTTTIGGERTGADQVATMTVAVGTTTVTVGEVTSFVTKVTTVRDPSAEGGTAQGNGGSSGGLNTTSQITLGVGLGIGIPALGLLAYIVYLLLKQHEREIQDKNGNPAFRPGGIGEDGVKSN
ncbi:hypothetical protein TWF281_008886 [Arthrobotrys megalospora]